MESDSEIENTPPEIREAANEATYNTLPEKSKDKYIREYNLFKEWSSKNNVKNASENSILAYFYEKSKVLKSSSLWSKYSMLRTTLIMKNNVDIKYPKLIAFLKRQADGYKPKKSETFTREDINKFLCEAPDNEYLLMKVCMNN